MKAILAVVLAALVVSGCNGSRGEAKLREYHALYGSSEGYAVIVYNDNPVTPPKGEVTMVCNSDGDEQTNLASVCWGRDIAPQQIRELIDKHNKSLGLAHSR